MKSLFTLILVCSFIFVQAQELITGSYDFQTDPSKDYTLYIPSNYETGTPNDMMVALHPLNTNRWNANSWCDTLKIFAEMNNLLLVCPDGGADGKIDDAIDTAFTTFLIDEVRTMYTINDDQIFAMGFSWGGKTTYTYGLQHADRFAGLMPIGAAINSGEVTALVDLSKDENFYVIHGSNDSPNTRFTPIINMVSQNHCVETKLLPGVGHTIDFENRDAILTEGFQQLKNTPCLISSLETEIETATFLINNILQSGTNLAVADGYEDTEFTILNMKGDTIQVGLGNTLQAPKVTGQYILTSEKGISQKFMVTE